MSAITKHAEVNLTHNGAVAVFNLGQSFDEGKSRVEFSGGNSSGPFYTYTYYWTSASQIYAWVRDGENCWQGFSGTVTSKCVVQEFKQ